jgi:hypothetical protein
MRTLLVAIFLFVGAVDVRAALLFYDGFDYTSGQPLAPTNDTTGSPNPGQLNVAYGVNWRYAGAGGGVNAAPSVGSGTLSYPGLQASTGNSAAHDMTQIGSARIQVAPAAISSGTVYWSALLRVNDVGTLTTGVNGMLLGGFNNATGAGTLPTVVGAVLRIRKDAADMSESSYFIGTGMNSGTGTGANGTNVQFDNGNPHLEGATVFVVGSYEFVDGATNDIARMWINPSALSFGAPAAPAATLTSSPGSAIADTFASLVSFNLRNVNTVGNPSVQFDELRVGDDWASVTPTVPEPTSASLLLVSVIMGRWRRGLVRA